ncbi:MAG: 50S ribosomal protein L23 [Verrucomicrobia bacterium GWF2_62_7]|nr:MAG: 50S ribosomal protein L23 [Verrucomicrobia bacterium GWF2_62_7]
MRDPHQIIKTLRVTEKGSAQSAQSNQYTLEVASVANKIEIKQAIEKLFKVKVLKVNTLTVHGKIKRMRASVGKQSDWKKAIVTLKAGDKIELA